MAKKHLVIICGVYYPEPSPTGLCVKRFVELLNNDFDIDLLCISDNGKCEHIRTNDGIVVHTLSGGVFTVKNRTRGLISKIFHQIGRLQIKTHILGNLGWYKHAVIKKLIEIDEICRIDTLFSICSPFVAHVAAKEYKSSHPDINWCAYTVDPYSTPNRISPIGYTLKRISLIERDTLRKSDSLLLSDEVFNNRNDLYNGHPCCKPLPYIMPDINTSNSKYKYFDKNNINCVYAGRFYEDIRNPELLLSVFSCFKDNNIKLYLFSKGCEERVASYVTKCNNIIRKHQVAHSDMEQIYSESDVLISISNTTIEFLPSKTFEYIATGKPIVCFNCNDTDKNVLKNYPLKFFVYNNEEIDSVEQFIINSKGKDTPKKDIESIYERHMTSSVRNILIDVLYDNKV